MPLVRQRITISLPKRLHAFLRFEAGVSRAIPEDPDRRSERLAAELRKLKESNARLTKSLGESKASNARLTKSLRKGAKPGGKADPPAPNFVDAPGGEIPLPPNNARPCGPSQADDAEYVQSADEVASRLIENLGVAAGTSILDVGCGPGRIAIGLARRLGDDLSYRGLDVNARWAGWAKKNITPAKPGYRFTHLDVKSERYNPEGALLSGDFAFPVTDGYYDFACLFSVFTHMMPDDVRIYFRELHRVLKPGGRILYTAFMEDGVPEVEENPPGYLGRDWSGPLHCVRYERSFLNGIAEESGFRIDGESPDRNFQRHVYVTRA